MKIYVASPLGFYESGRDFLYGKVIPLLVAGGYEILDPWKLTPKEETDRVAALPYGEEQRRAWRQLNEVIGQNNENAIEEADALVAILDGPDVDSGTASEIGFAAAKNIPTIGYRSDFRLAGDNAGATVNLQVEHFICSRGGEILSDLNLLVSKLDALLK